MKGVKRVKGRRGEKERKRGGGREIKIVREKRNNNNHITSS